MWGNLAENSVLIVFSWFFRLHMRRNTHNNTSSFKIDLRFGFCTSKHLPYIIDYKSRNFCLKSGPQNRVSTYTQVTNFTLKIQCLLYFMLTSSHFLFQSLQSDVRYRLTKQQITSVWFDFISTNSQILQQTHHNEMKTLNWSVSFVHRRRRHFGYFWPSTYNRVSNFWQLFWPKVWGVDL